MCFLLKKSAEKYFGPCKLVLVISAFSSANQLIKKHMIKIIWSFKYSIEYFCFFDHWNWLLGRFHLSMYLQWFMFSIIMASKSHHGWRNTNTRAPPGENASHRSTYLTDRWLAICGICGSLRYTDCNSVWLIVLLWFKVLVWIFTLGLMLYHSFCMYKSKMS